MRFLLLILFLLPNFLYSQQIIETCEGYRSEYTYYAQSIGTTNELRFWTVNYNGIINYYFTETINLNFLDTGFCNISVYIEDQNLCLSRVQNYRINIIPCKDTYFYVPNSFTPNFDGINDIFFPKGENYTDLEILIYNRWGQLIFQSNDPNGWDGTYSVNSNYLAPDGVYCYIIYYRDLKNMLQRRVGSVTLLR